MFEGSLAEMFTGPFSIGPEIDIPEVLNSIAVICIALSYLFKNGA
jgi:hypothetical protein